MSHEIEIIRDDKGIAVIGDPDTVERFLTKQGVTKSRDLRLSRLASAFSVGAAATQSGAEIASMSGRWILLTQSSAAALSAGITMTGSTAGVARAIVTHNGKISNILEYVRGPGAVLANPAILAGAAGIMAQLAMKQSMDEITDYLATIDAKVDDVLRAQKDEAVAGMIGAELEIDEAMILRDEVGHVSEVTWSKVQGSSSTLKTTQAYALRQLDALADKMEKNARVGDLAETFDDAEGTVEEWLAVIARCFQLQDALAVIELDRVLDSAPDDLDAHRRGIAIARQKRLDVISQTTRGLLSRMDGAATSANAKVLFHPFAPGAIVHSSNDVATDVVMFHQRLGIDGERESIEARRWTEAATDAKDKALEKGTEGVEAASHLGAEGVKVASRLGAEGARVAGKFGAAALTRGLSLREKLAEAKGRKSLGQGRERRELEES
ncbi:hypothetical protein AX769_11385 [Frondihabitans sp. PAMC 28766]|uniref:hypothetical protein n=1 Tax=Frondihabitans sp. PAMC 28766 TaxID=1795630 RepID=UPI00078C75F8|nr:hypothetical protein [Frondihabitans sp. PAMC 28766]AMM20634.1 hypothetical protein AX769_11385 [Frondihabitans sp. PAMC 28766]